MLDSGFVNFDGKSSYGQTSAIPKFSMEHVWKIPFGCTLTMLGHTETSGKPFIT